MKYKLFSDTNMVNACMALELEGIEFRHDLVNNTLTIPESSARAHDIIRDEGGEEIK